MASSSAPELRASDADREAVVERLREHAGTGRLTPAELEKRVEAALSARTLGELGALERDLPGRPPARRARGGPRRLRPEWAVYLAVNAMLVAIWALTGAGYFWPVWPLLGWGVLLAIPCSKSGSKAGREAHRGRQESRQGTDEVWV
jgi:L-alanine-DL-glutamate epimerase-like enolase superfamily enzyme